MVSKFRFGEFAQVREHQCDEKAMLLGSEGKMN